QENHSFLKALESYQRAAVLDPDRAAVHFRMGMVLSKLGRWPEAVDAYLEVIRLQPTHAEAHLNLGFVYYELALASHSEEAFDRARQLGSLADASGKMRF